MWVAAVSLDLSLLTFLQPLQYISELEQLLMTAKHPRIRLLLQKALNDATIAQRSEVAAGEVKKSGDDGKTVTAPTPQGPSRPSVAGMSKITNYGVLITNSLCFIH